MSVPSPHMPGPEGVSSRTLLKATTATAGAIAAATALGELAPSAEAATGFVKGVDINWAPQMEAHGHKPNSAARSAGPPAPGRRWSPASRRSSPLVGNGFTQA